MTAAGQDQHLLGLGHGNVETDRIPGHRHHGPAQGRCGVDHEVEGGAVGGSTGPQGENPRSVVTASTEAPAGQSRNRVAIQCPSRSGEARPTTTAAYASAGHKPAPAKRADLAYRHLGLHAEAGGGRSTAPSGDVGEFPSDTWFFTDLPGYPITTGTSFVMTLEFTDDGPVAEALLTYGQPDDPEDPDFTAQTELFSAKQWRPIRFTDADISADPTLTETTVEGRP